MPVHNESEPDFNDQYVGECLFGWRFVSGQAVVSIQRVEDIVLVLAQRCVK